MRQGTKDAGVCVLAAAVFLAILGGITHKARSQDHVGHAEFHDFYKDWKIPDSPVGASCCNAKRDMNGELVGDCYPTTARVVNGQWIVKTDHGTEIAVPDEKIIHEPNPDPTGQDAHLCEGVLGDVLCFRPPVGGS